MKLFGILIVLFVALSVNAATITVPRGGDMQAAIKAANCGDTIIGEAGATYPVNATFSKPCTVDITIQSSRASELPAGMRVGPSQPSLLVKFVSVVPAEPVIKTSAGASHYKLIGIEMMTANQDLVVYDLVRLGDGKQAQSTLAQVPSDIVIDRSYIHGWEVQNLQRGISLNCVSCDITNNWISEIHSTEFEAQGIAGWNGLNNARILNNEIQASTQGVLIGGADSASPEMMPQNIVFRGNHVFKPLGWLSSHYVVKNLFELKAAKNVTIEASVFENNWGGTRPDGSAWGQDGTPILFTTRNQECSAPWSTIQGVKFAYNTVKNANGVFNFLGIDNESLTASSNLCVNRTNPQPGSVRGSDVAISQSLFINLKPGAIITNNGFYNVSMDRVTSPQDPGNITTLYGEPVQGLRITNSLLVDHEYGFYTEKGIGVPGLSLQAPGWVIENNTIAAPYDKSVYPANNDYPPSLPFSPDFRSPIPNRGVDVDALAAAQSGSVVSTPTPSPTPSPSTSPTPTPTPSPVASPTPTSTPTPSPTPAPTPTPTPLPGQGQIEARRMSRDLSTQALQIKTAQGEGLKFLGCTEDSQTKSVVCYFERKP